LIEASRSGARDRPGSPHFVDHFPADPWRLLQNEKPNNSKPNL
jgi:hypothetical protein